MECFLQFRAENVEADDFDIPGLVLAYHRWRKLHIRGAPTVNGQNWAEAYDNFVWGIFKIIADF